MHELSIAQNIIEAVIAAMPEHALRRVSAVGIRLGTLSSVDAEALRFGYEALTKDTPLAESELRIETVPTRAVCRKCGHEFGVDDFVFICPRCESSQSDLISGQELEIAYFEGD